MGNLRLIDLFKSKLFSRVAYATIVVFTIIFMGSFGYMMIDSRFSFVDAFYMTVITITTVGFGEVHELSDAGKVFTAFLIISSFSIFAYTISTLTSFILSGEYKKYYNTYKLEKEVKKYKNHIILCGFGRVGQQAAEELLLRQKTFVLIEKKDELFEKVHQEGRIMVLQGDATQDENLIRAGIHEAAALITTLPNDADNLYAVLTARELNKNLTIISRASSSNSVRKLKIAGANNVIMPDRLGGSHMASLVVTPDVMEFLDHISIRGSADINLEELRFNELPEEFHGMTLGELDVRNKIGVNIIGYRGADGEYIINPGPKTKIENDCKLFVLGNPRQIALLNRALKIQIDEGE